MIEEQVRFQNEEKSTLGGTLYKPESVAEYPTIIVAHAAQGGTRDWDVYQHLAETLTQLGIAVLVFDRRGEGQSTGNFHNTSFEDLASDLLSAKDTLKARQDIKQIGLWGMSQGGWLAPFAAALSEDIAFLIVVSGATITPAEQMLYSATFALEENGFTDAEIDEMRALRKLYDDYYRNKASRAATQKRLKEAESQAWFQFSYMSTDLPDNVETTKWHKILEGCAYQSKVYQPFQLCSLTKRKPSPTIEQNK